MGNKSMAFVSMRLNLMKWGVFVEKYITSRIVEDTILVAVTAAQFRVWKSPEIIIILAKPAVCTYWNWGPGEELLFGASKKIAGGILH